MRNTLSLLVAAAVVAVIGVGCTGPEKKLGRGLNNVGEVVRWGETTRSIEQAGIWQGPQAANGVGFISGITKSLCRIGVGVFEVVTFPIPTPNYDPMFTSYLSPSPQFPDSYKPRLRDNTIFATDTSLGFSGGDLFPAMPGSRFSIFNGAP